MGGSEERGGRGVIWGRSGAVFVKSFFLYCILTIYSNFKGCVCSSKKKTKQTKPQQINKSIN